jgi:hypothetical protein
LTLTDIKGVDYTTTKENRAASRPLEKIASEESDQKGNNLSFHADRFAGV